MARYYSHSPRGFSNEINVYAVADEIAADWADEFERGLDDHSADRFDEIDAKQAHRLRTSKRNNLGQYQEIQ